MDILHFWSSTPWFETIKNFNNFLAKQLRYSNHTVEGYLLDIKNFYLFLNTENNFAIEQLNNIDITTFRSWLANRIEHNLSPRSNGRAISSLKTFFKYLNQNQISQNTVIFNISKPKMPKLLPKSLNSDVVYDLIEKAGQLNKKEWQNLRDQALIILLFSTGLRISEAISLTKSDISTERDFFNVTGKGSKERIVPLLATVKEIIIKYISSLPFSLANESNIFISNTGKKYTSRMAQKTIEIIRKNCNLPDYITPHSLRHSFATVLFNNSEDVNSIEKIQHLLGHSNLSTTQIYTKVSGKNISRFLEKANYYD